MKRPVLKGTISAKRQVTLPASVVRELHLKPGDTVEFEVNGTTIQLRPSTPDLAATFAQFEIHGSAETGNDAVAAMRRARGWEDAE